MRISAQLVDAKSGNHVWAERYDRERGRALFEARWLARFSSALTPGGRVLDLGCGAGEPIAGWFIREGFDVTGMDFSPAMLQIASDRFAQATWLQGDMRTLDLADRFDGIVGWNSFFHLTPEEQRVCIPRLATHLAPGGALMLTVGPRHGSVTGTVGGETVYHASLSPAEYAARLEECGLRLTAFIAEDPETQSHSVLMARKDL